MSEQEANQIVLPNGAVVVAQCLEQLIKDTNEDLQNFRVEQSQLRTQIISVINENRHLTGKLDNYKELMASGGTEDMHKRLNFTNDALAKALEQIRILQKDRTNMVAIQACSDRTIRNMENELNSYRTQLSSENSEEAKHGYTSTIRNLTSQLGMQEEQLKIQTGMIKALHEYKQRSGIEIDRLESNLKNIRHFEIIHETTQNKFTELQKKVNYLEKTLLRTRAKLEASVKREDTAMRKVQDAIAITEAAEQEKKEAERRAASYKEEAKQLATNVGNIMDEAAKRVDSEVAELKIKLVEKDKTIALLREKMKNDAEEHKAIGQLLENQNTRITQKYKEIIKINEKLELQIETNNKRLIELEACAIKDEAHLLRSKKNHETQMESYVRAYKELKVHYKELITDLTKKFEVQLESIQKEKWKLQMDYETLKQNGSAQCSQRLL